MATTTTGTIRCVRIDKGYLFIHTRDHGEVFAHCRDLAPELPFDEQLLQMRVEFSLEQTLKGLRARFVRPAD